VIRGIAGRNNASVKLAGKLQKKKFRTERGLFVAEGLDLLLAADTVGASPVEILVREDLVERLPRRLRDAAQAGTLDIGVCDPVTLAGASSLGGASDVIALFPLPSWSLGDLRLGEGVTMYLHGVGDPGNVGTIVRGAVAFGAAGVACSPGTADPYGPKAIRAGMGAQFLMPVVTEVGLDDLEAKLAAEESRGNPAPTVIVADPRADVDCRLLAETVGRQGGQGSPTGVVVVLGSERGGLPEFRRPVLRVSVPQARFDSLNVAMAATILLYELSANRIGEESPFPSETTYSNRSSAPT
jgi:TrmH family RNA methyltransferase